MPAKGHSRFGAISGKGKEPFPGPARKQYSKRVSHVRWILPWLTFLPGVRLPEGSRAIRHSMYSGDLFSDVTERENTTDKMKLAASSAS
jgi:hypothetical protein